MLDNRKISLMARLALYEKKEGKKDFRLAKYYRSDYVRFQMLKTFFYVTLGLGIFAVMLAAYKVEYFFHIAEKNYVQFGFLLLAVYLLILVVSEIVTAFLSAYRIKSSRERLGKYYNNLRSLRKYYKGNEEI